MKNILLIFLVFFGLFSSVAVKAQPFSMAVSADTIYATANSSGQVPGATDFITNTSTPAGLTLKWRVTGTSFPADWLTQAAFGICDNGVCRNNNGDTLLWNNTTGIGSLNTTASYIYDSSMTFDLSLYLLGASTGTHWVSVLITDPALTPAYSKLIYFMITNGTATVVNPVVRPNDDVILYPNPARDEINVVYDASADVKNIVVYNIIGKIMTVYKVTDNSSANLNIENIPSGFYFVRLVNSQGQAVATKKFTKQ